jgi:magnesium transporter
VDPGAPRPVLTAIALGPGGYVERVLASPRQVQELLGKWPVTWLNVDGLGDARVIEELGEIFGIHRLALEDVLDPSQRPKVEPYGDHAYLVARMCEWKERLETDQLSLFIGKDWVLTFQQVAGDCFDGVRERIRRGGGRIRQAGADYLGYAILDATVDAYFPALEACGEKIESLEDGALAGRDTRVVQDLQHVRHDLLQLRRATWPLRDALGSLVREDSPLFSAETKPYLRDCHDHVVQTIDLVETYRELAAGLMEVYLSAASNRMSEVMKVLTIIATIFIPLSFIASVYGMNFDTQRSRWNMPELEWRLGYPFALALMAVTALGLLYYFSRKGWLLSGPRGGDAAAPPAGAP